MSKKDTVLIRFNKLRAKLPHRYTRLVAEKAGTVSPLQVKLVFEGRLQNPEIISKVHAAALKVAALHTRAQRLHSRKYRKTVNV